MKRSAKVGALATLVGVQVIAVIAYRHVEERREVDAATVLPNALPVASDGQIGNLWVADRQGYRTDIGALDRPTIVHFWATWCAPCLTELPALLAATDAGALPTLAVSVDSSWATVSQVFPTKHPALRLALNKDAATSGLNLQTLPVTLLVGPEGRILLRADGARDWTDPDFVAAWQR